MVVRMISPVSVISPPAAGLLDPELDGLGVVLIDGGARLRVWSDSADAIDLVVFDDTDLDWITATDPLVAIGGGVWEITTPLLRPGTRYAIRVDGPHAPGNTFNRGTLLLEPAPEEPTP